MAKALGSFIFSILLLAISCTAVFAQHPLLHPIKDSAPNQPIFPVYHKYTNWRAHLKIDPYKQDTLLHPIPWDRVIFHDRIDKEQLKADESDHKLDTFIMYKNDTALSVGITQALLCNVDTMQLLIENMPAEGRDSFAENQLKKRFLRAVWELLRDYNNDPRPDPAYYIALQDNMDSMLVAINKKKEPEFVDSNVNMYTLENSKTLFDKTSAARALLYTGLGMKDPVRMVKRLEEYADDTFAGRIIAAAAPIAPNIIFDYATSNVLSVKSAVYRTDDSLVQAIVKIAAFSKSPPKIFPFLSDVYRGRKTVEQLDTIADSPALYFENLVRLTMVNDSIGREACRKELAYRALQLFVRPMNELHEEPDDVRFRCIDSMSPQALYYMMICGQDEIYTSTFLGTFKRMMQRIDSTRSDRFLDTLHDDHFRTFIRMCAGYNTLSGFLAAMPDTARTGLMTRFIGGLEYGRENDLEDAVDVADAFGSIRDSALAVFLSQKVKEDYEQSYNEQSRKGMIIYSLLSRLFEGTDKTTNDTGASQMSVRLHLPPINKVPFRDLTNDSGIVYQQVFFFGDKDGKDSYESFMTHFKGDKKWDISEDSLKTVISSAQGHKLVIYANKPLDEPGDENAQDSLCKLLNDSGIHPTIVIHRGHSYHLPATLLHLNASARIVILGSCGGYHNLAMVLDRAPDAHIISSKQTGTMAVNEPIIESLNNRLLAGEDIDWVAMWQELETYFQKHADAQDKFSDYVPPYRNMGAIFIKAYRKMMQPH